MSEVSILALALLAGVLIGIIFYGGLWWTVRRSVSSPSSVWLIGSFPLRMIIAIGGFYFVSQGDWRRLMTCLVGFLMGRIGVTWLLPSSREQK